METLPDERTLVLKLVTTWHLNVPERRALPGGKARASLVIAAIQEALKSEDGFPPDGDPMTASMGLDRSPWRRELLHLLEG